MKRLLSIFAIGAFFFGHLAFASGTQDTPEARTNAFYTWYINGRSKPSFPLLDNTIFEYVSKDTVNRLRSDYRHDRLPDADYFLNVQDADEQDWLSHIATHPVVMLGDVAVIPVTFGSKNQVSVLVFMRHVGGSWKITKVDNTSDLR